MAIEFFHVKFRGREYRVDMDDLTNDRLIKMGQMLGKEYGTFDGLPRLMSERNSGAWACALWIGQQKHGYQVFDPREMDFKFSEFEFILDPDEEDEEVPTEAAPAAEDSDTTSDSQPIASSGSKKSSSSRSPKSAD